MKMSRSTFGISATAGVALAVAVGGVIAVAAAPSADYPHNERGQTYGIAPITSGYAQEPDLVGAVGVNGKVGYILRSDSDDASELFEVTETVAEDGSTVRIWYIPVYEADGVTIVDSFPIQEPASFDFDVEHYDLDILNVQEE